MKFESEFCLCIKDDDDEDEEAVARVFHLLLFMIFKLMFIYGGYTSTFRVCLIRRCGFYFKGVEPASKRAKEILQLGVSRSCLCLIAKLVRKFAEE